jgi:Short C-terminal domain
MFGRGWEPGQAKIVALKEIESIGRSGDNLTRGDKYKSYEFVADVQSDSGAPVFRTTMHEPFDDRGMFRVGVGSVVRVKCDPARQKAKFDLSADNADAKAQKRARIEAITKAASDPTPDASSAGAGRFVAGPKRVLFDSSDPKSAFPGLPAADGPSADPLERLQKLADLHDRGVLTDEEFEAEKAKILGLS